MTATETVDEDRLVHGMPDADYRRYPAVSQSGLKTILDSPARYRWERDHPTIKDAYDFGHVVHGLVLGVGEPVARLDFPDRRSKAYKDAVAEAREAGAIPLLAATHDELNIQGFRSAIVVLVFVVVFLDLFFRNLDVFHVGGRIKAHRTNNAGFAKNVV